MCLWEAWPSVACAYEKYGRVLHVLMGSMAECCMCLWEAWLSVACAYGKHGQVLHVLMRSMAECCLLLNVTLHKNTDTTLK